MTKEQREAIKSLNEFVNTKYGAFTAKEGQTVLSMLKEQQEENKKKDKIIDLMTEIFYKRFKAELLLEYGFESEEQLKQDFENKAKE